MQIPIFIVVALLFGFSPRVFATEFKDKGETIAVETPADWISEKVRDGKVTQRHVARITLKDRRG